MLTPPDERTAQALARLRLSDDFQKVVAWLKDQHEVTLRRCSTLLEETQLRQYQGATQTLRDILAAAATNDDRKAP